MAQLPNGLVGDQVEGMIQLVCGILILQIVGIKNPLHIGLPSHIFRLDEQKPHTPLRFLIISDKLSHSLQQARVQPFLPVGIGCKGKQADVREALDRQLLQVFFQQIGVIGQLFQIGADAVPIHGGEELLHLLLPGGLIPFPIRCPF